MLRIASIALGGALGALLRWLCSNALLGRLNVFPLGTLFVNLSGSLLIGLLWGYFDNITVSDNIRLFIFIGLLGSFTTFSTFSLENMHLLKNGEYSIFFINLIVNVFGGLLLVFGGYLTGKNIN